MKLKVLKKQNISRDCVVCGQKNEWSLKTKFYECEGDIICAVLQNENWHQSFPGRMHGGMISAVLDEAIGRAVMIKNPDQWGVTGELKVRFLKPTPLDTTLICVTKLVSENGRLFKGVGYLEDKNGTLLATAEATYFKLDIQKITTENLAEHWFYENSEIPEFIETSNLEKLEILAKKAENSK